MLTFTTVNFAITADPITVTPTSGQSKVYGAVDPIFAYTFSPTLVGSDTFSGALTRTAGSNVGNYALSRGSLSLSSNYTVTVTTGVTFAITTKSITVTPSSGQKQGLRFGRSRAGLFHQSNARRVRHSRRQLDASQARTWDPTPSPGILGVEQQLHHHLYQRNKLCHHP